MEAIRAKRFEVRGTSKVVAGSRREGGGVSAKDITLAVINV